MFSPGRAREDGVALGHQRLDDLQAEQADDTIGATVVLEVSLGVTVDAIDAHLDVRDTTLGDAVGGDVEEAHEACHGGGSVHRAGAAHGARSTSRASTASASIRRA
jgi:hypothetical protein